MVKDRHVTGIHFKIHYIIHQKRKKSKQYNHHRFISSPSDDVQLARVYSPNQRGILLSMLLYDFTFPISHSSVQRISKLGSAQHQIVFEQASESTLSVRATI